jgi:hypothetical protein
MENALEAAEECAVISVKNYRRGAETAEKGKGAQPGVAVPHTPTGRLAFPGGRCIAHCKELAGCPSNLLLVGSRDKRAGRYRRRTKVRRYPSIPRRGISG